MVLHVLFYIWIVLLLFVSRHSIQKFGFVANHYVLTNCYWALCLFISIFHNYYIHPVSKEVYYIFFIGNLFFNLTLFTSNIKVIPNSFDVSHPFSLNRRRLLEIIVLVTLIPMAYANLKAIIAGGEMWIMYEEYWDARVNNNYIEELFKQNVIEPISYVLMATCFFSNYNGLKKNSKLYTVIISTCIAILNMLMTAGGRTGLVRFMFFIALSYITSSYIKKPGVIYKINIRYVSIFFGLGVAAFSFATLQRGGVNVFDIIFERISLFPAVFESYYNNTNILNGYAWGLSMFEQPISFVLYPFKMLGMDVSFERISTVVAQSVWTPATESMHNAAASAYTFYMRDFGIYGVAIGPFLVGNIYNLLWKFCRRDPFLLLFYFCGVCVTCIDSTYPFARGYFFAILFAFLVRNFLKNTKYAK